MQLIWYLPSLVIGLTVGFASGYWQLALVSVAMASLMVLLHFYRNRYPQFEPGSTVHISTGQVAINNRVLPRYELFWKKQWNEILVNHFQTRSAPDFLTQLLSQKYAEGFWSAPSAELELWLGATASSELSLNLATQGPHLLIVGPTGSGKSELLKLMLGSLLENQRVELVLFDFKGGATLEKFASAATGMGTDLEPRGSLKLWDYIFEELVSREKQFAEAGVSDIHQFNSLGRAIEPIVIVIDEFAACLASGPKASSGIEDVLARGRSLGIYLIAASQSLTGISRSLLTNLRVRVVMQSADPIDFVQLGINPNKTSPPPVEGFGQGVLMSPSRASDGFYFPLGFMPAPRPEPSQEVRERPRPVRSQLLRQMYLVPGQEKDPPLEQPSSPDSQLLSRMEGLRWSEHR
jgi:energy-coupling factor transporter ATP-binding protein EcfA2